MMPPPPVSPLVALAGKIMERALIWDEGEEDDEGALTVTVEKGKEWILWNGPGKGKGGGAAGMRVLVGGPTPGMINKG